MTRCSNCAAILVLLVAAPVMGDTFVADAFGLHDPVKTAPERRDWAGQRDKGDVIAPQEPDRLVIFAGPKSIVAGKDPGHVVAIVVDRFGNLVADGTPATVTVAGDLTPTTTTGGIADQLVTPRTRAEELFVGVTAGARQSPKAMLGITADIASIRPQVAGPVPDAGSDTEFSVASVPMVDRYGNQVPEGTSSTTVLRHADGSFSLVQAIAMQDTTRARFIARDIPGPVQATITLGTQSSGAVPFAVLAPVSAGLPALALEDLSTIGALRLTLGPFMTTNGYTLADGAQVTVSASLSNGSEVSETAWVLDGEVSVLLPIGPDAAVERLRVQSPLGPMDLTQGWSAAVASLPASEVSP